MAIDTQEINLTAYLDIKGAFDRTSFEGMALSLTKHGVGDTICRWITKMLKRRPLWRYQ